MEYYPSYDKSLETAEPITDLFSALSLLEDKYDGDSRYFCVKPPGHKNRPPYIIVDGYYRRSGEYIGSDLVRVSDELVDELTQCSAGKPYMGGSDESVRSLSPRGKRRFEELLQEKETELRAKLIPGTHGWSSLYRYYGLVYTHLETISNRSHMGMLKIPAGIQFVNPIQEEWTVLFDGRVLREKEYADWSEAEHEQFTTRRKAVRSAKV